MIIPSLAAVRHQFCQRRKKGTYHSCATGLILIISLGNRRFTSSATGACKCTGNDQFDAVIFHSNRSRGGTFNVDGYSWHMMNIKLHRDHKSRRG